MQKIRADFSAREPAHGHRLLSPDFTLFTFFDGWGNARGGGLVRPQGLASLLDNTIRRSAARGKRQGAAQDAAGRTAVFHGMASVPAALERAPDLR